MNYTQAYSKIIDAYFKDEIRPMSTEFCFCGTLNNNNSNWVEKITEGFKRSQHNYSKTEYERMEEALIIPIMPLGIAKEGRGCGKWCKLVSSSEIEGHPNYESLLFAGMSAALDVLKQIHIERGEIIDPLPRFTRRAPSLTNKTS